jgi:hypothetical protein
MSPLKFFAGKRAPTVDLDHIRNLRCAWIIAEASLLVNAVGQVAGCRR